MEFQGQYFFINYTINIGTLVMSTGMLRHLTNRRFIIIINISDNKFPAYPEATMYNWDLFSDVGGLSALYWTSRLRHLSTLHWRWWDGRTSGATLPSARSGAAGVMAQSPLPKRPKTPVALPGEDQGGNPSARPGMRERERELGSAWTQQLS